EPRPRLAQKIQAAEIAVASNDDADALKLLDEICTDAAGLGDTISVWRCHAELAALHRRAGRLADTEREYQAAIGVIEGERSRMQRDEFKLSFLSHLIRFYGDYVDFMMERGDYTGAFRLAQSSRARLLFEKQHRSGAVDPTVELPKLQNKLRASRAVLLSYWLAPRRSFVWMVDGTKFEVHTLPPEAEIAARVMRYGEAIQRGQNPIESGSEDGRWLLAN